MTKVPKTKLCNGSSDSNKHKIANDTCWSLIANAKLQGCPLHTLVELYESRTRNQHWRRDDR